MSDPDPKAVDYLSAMHEPVHVEPPANRTPLTAPIGTVKTLRAVLRATLGPLRRTPDHCELVETIERVLRETSEQP